MPDTLSTHTLCRRSGGWTASLGLAVLAFALPMISPVLAQEPTKKLSAAAQIGRDMFYDPDMSASGQIACSSCHDPANHYAPSNDLVVQPGGPHMHQFGIRTVPTLTYELWTPAFSIGPEDETSEINETSPMADAGKTAAAITVLKTIARTQAKTAGSVAMVPMGGMFRDGRTDTLQGQAAGVLTSGIEMGNKDEKTLGEHIKSKYGARLAALFGPSILNDPQMLAEEAEFALARYQIEDPSFHLFTSKWDYVLKGEAKLTPAEERGLKLYEDTRKGNCADCHPNRPSPNGTPAMFTDFQYEALAVPRNPDIPVDKDPTYFDIGICGPARADSYSTQPQNCGMFKTPTLRNVVTRHVFFHNGAFKTLDDVIDFYVNRDIAPEKFYPKLPDGSVDIYNDIPQKYLRDVDQLDPPFDRAPGDKPALNPKEIQDLKAYLETLTDGYNPKTGKLETALN